MKDKKLATILLGAPGSGKGTQGELLEKRSKYKKYVMSSLIKKELKKGTKSKKKWVNEYNVEDGSLLSDLDIFELFRENFKLENQVILDGIPRTVDQSYWLYGFLKEHKYEIKVLFLNCDEKKLLNRIKIRAKEQERKDDKPEIFKERLKIYDKVKNSVLSIYKEEIVEIDGDKSIEDVEKEIIKKLRV